MSQASSVGAPAHAASSMVGEIDDGSPSQLNQVEATSGAAAGREVNDLLEKMQVHDNDEEDDDSSSDEDTEEYNSIHRLVLQGIMASGYVDSRRVRKLFVEVAKFLGCTIPRGKDLLPYIQKVITEVNAKIKMLDMVIKSSTCEITGDKFYVFLVTAESAILRLQTFYSAAEVEFFEKVTDTILRKQKNFSLSPIECLNLVMEMECRTFSKLLAEEFIETLLGQQYFTKVYPYNDVEKEEDERDYNITLGFRAIREFESVFRVAYPNIFGTCCMCKTVLLNGYKCPQCPVVAHRFCLRKYVKSCKHCVACKAPWEDEEALIVRSRDCIEEPSQGASKNKAGKRGESSKSAGQRIFTAATPVSDGAVASTSAGCQSSGKESRKAKVSRKRIRVISSSESD